MTRVYELKVIPGNQPKFSWKLKGNSNQIGYKIFVTGEDGKNIYTSDLVNSEYRHNIQPVELSSNTFFDWSVKVYFEDGYEEVQLGSRFFTPIGNWQAQWIEPKRTRKPMTDKKFAWEVQEKQTDPLTRLDAPFYVRKTFDLSKPVQHALIYTSARGIYELYINGHLVSDLFAPGYTSYTKRIEYQIYDIAKYLNKGTNVIGMVVADGWYTGKIEYIGVGQQYGTENSLILQLQMSDDEGKQNIITSDSSFKWSLGPRKYADLYVGEYYDNNDSLDNWLDADYDDTSWKELTIKNYSRNVLKMQTIPAIKEIRVIRPKIIRTPKGELILDAGETIVGYTSFNDIKLTPGEKISLEHSETLDKDGNFLQNILGQNKQQKDFFIADKNQSYSWCPRLSFHGFRYVKVMGTNDCDPNHYMIHVIATPMEQTGFVNTSDQRINQLQDNILRSQVGNMIAIPTDCPQRERTGWAGDIQVYAPTAAYEMDVEQFLSHWLEDMRNEQSADGQVPQVVPCADSHDYMRPEGIETIDTAGWSDAAVIVPWRLYQAYGDKSVLSDNYTMIKRYMKSVEKLVRKLPDDGMDKLDSRSLDNNHYLWNTDFQFGDWLMPGYPGTKSADATGKEVATLLYILTTGLMVKISHVLQDSITEKYYQELNSRIKEAFVEEYMTDDGIMTSDYQGVYVLALATNTVPEKLKKNTLNRLVELISTNGDRLGTGFLSVAYLLPVLHDNGLDDMAKAILFQDQCPSWLYEVKMGATTMWEAWDAYDLDGTPNEYSMNHYAFGCVGEYIFRTILGIDYKTEGFKHVLINPDFDCGLSRVSGSFDSVWGKISVNWERVGDNISLSVQLPPNVEADINIGGIIYHNVTFEKTFNQTLKHFEKNNILSI